MENTQKIINDPVLEKAKQITAPRNEVINHYKLSELITIPTLVVEQLRECDSIVSLLPVDINKAINNSGMYKFIDSCMDAGIFITGEYISLKNVPYLNLQIYICVENTAQSIEAKALDGYVSNRLDLLVCEVSNFLYEQQDFFKSVCHYYSEPKTMKVKCVNIGDSHCCKRITHMIKLDR